MFVNINDVSSIEVEHKHSNKQWNMNEILRVWFKIHKEMNLYFPFLFIPPAACTTKLLDKLCRCNCSLTVPFALVDFVPVNQSNLVKKKKPENQ